MGPQMLTGVSSLPFPYSLSSGLHQTALLTLCGKFLEGTEAQGPSSPPDNVSTAWHFR